MKRISIFLALIAILSISCKKDNNTEIIDQEQEQRLTKSNQEFINSDWTFDTTGDSLKDQLIGLWLSNEVIKADTIRFTCDTLFTWVLESTGTMVERNNYWGDDETQYGDWKIDSNAKHIYYSWKEYQMGGTGYSIVTDTINIEKLTDSTLWTSHFIHYSTTKMDIKFDRLK